MKSVKYHVSKPLWDFSFGDLTNLFHRSMFVIRGFIRDCTIPDSARMAHQSCNEHKVIHVSASQKKAFAKAFFNPPKSSTLLQGLRQLLE